MKRKYHEAAERFFRATNIDVKSISKEQLETITSKMNQSLPKIKCTAHEPFVPRVAKLAKNAKPAQDSIRIKKKKVRMNSEGKSINSRASQPDYPEVK